MAERTSTLTALTGARSLLSSVDHEGRKRLDADLRLTLVAEVVALGRQLEALRAVLVAEADRAKAGEVARGASVKSLLAVGAQVTAGEAAAWVYAGQEIIGRPRVQQAALAGEVSVAQARAIDKVLGELPATLRADQREQAEGLLLEQAARVDAKDLARQTRRVLQAVAPEVDAVEDELARLDAQRKQAWAARSLAFMPDGRGSMLIRGQLPLLEGEQLKKLVETHATTNRQAFERAGGCDAQVIPVVLGAASEPLDVGREQRLVTPAIRRALEVRDGGCAFPGCRVPAHACEAHHVVPWWAGGATTVENPSKFQAAP